MVLKHVMMVAAMLLAVGGLARAQTARAVTAEERQEILDAHNEARSRTAQQQGVENMPEMVWSDVVAQLGLDYLRSAGCPFSHNPNRRLPNGTTAGENLANGHQSWRAAIYDAWYLSEEPAFLQNTAGVTGHYTQVVWTRSLEVGCAFCDRASGGFDRLYICNYSPAGNFIGQDPWTSGSGVCNDCPSTHPECSGDPFPGLCTAEAVPGTTTSGGNGDGNPSETSDGDGVQPGETEVPALGYSGDAKSMCKTSFALLSLLVAASYSLQ